MVVYALQWRTPRRKWRLAWAGDARGPCCAFMRLSPQMRGAAAAAAPTLLPLAPNNRRRRGRLVTAAQLQAEGALMIGDGRPADALSVLELAVLFTLYPLHHDAAALAAWHRSLASNDTAFAGRRAELARTLALVARAQQSVGLASHSVDALEAAVTAGRAAVELLATTGALRGALWRALRGLAARRALHVLLLPLRAAGRGAGAGVSSGSPVSARCVRVQPAWPRPRAPCGRRSTQPASTCRRLQTLQRTAAAAAARRPRSGRRRDRRRRGRRPSWAPAPARPRRLIRQRSCRSSWLRRRSTRWRCCETPRPLSWSAC